MGDHDLLHLDFKYGTLSPPARHNQSSHPDVLPACLQQLGEASCIWLRKVIMFRSPAPRFNRTSSCRSRLMIPWLKDGISIWSCACRPLTHPLSRLFCKSIKTHLFVSSQ